MQFEYEQLVAVPPDAVEAAFVDPAFYEGIECSSALAVREVLGRTEADGEVTLRMRLAFTGDVSSAVRAFVDPSRLTWVTVVTQRTGARQATFAIEPDHYASLLTGSGGYRYLEQPGGAATVVRASGDLSVKVPVVGRRAERAIAEGFAGFLADEARALATRAG